MSDPTTAGVDDFTLARKGYDVDQVEHVLGQLIAARDEAWQRLAALGDEMRRLERRLMDLQATQVVAEATVPDFEVLSPRAAGLLATAREEAEAVRADALAEAARIDGEARTQARRVRITAGQYAEQVRAAAEESLRSALDGARNQAEALRGEAEADVREARDAASAYAAEAQVRAEQASREAHSWLAGQQRTVEQEFAAHEANVAAWEDQVIAIGERKVAESEQHLKAMQARSDEIDADAASQAERLVEAARREAARIAEQTDRDQATFAERGEQVQGQLDHIREALVALTGSVADPPEPTGTTEPTETTDTTEDEAAEAEAGPAAAFEPEPDSEAETSELPTLPQAVDNSPDGHG